VAKKLIAPANMPCHRLVRATAIGIAEQVYDALMKDNLTYRDWKSKVPQLTPEKLHRLWKIHAWPSFIPAARAQLAAMLESEAYSERMKDEISEALILDNSLGRGQIKVEMMEN
jgi:hypothetical protein